MLKCCGAREMITVTAVSWGKSGIVLVWDVNLGKKIKDRKDRD